MNCRQPRDDAGKVLIVGPRSELQRHAVLEDRFGEVDHVVVPGSEGEFGVLPSHAPAMSVIKPAADRLRQAQILGGRAVAPRLDVADKIAAVNHATVAASRATITAVLDDIAADRARSYAALRIAAAAQ